MRSRVRIPQPHTRWMSWISDPVWPLADWKGWRSNVKQTKNFKSKYVFNWSVFHLFFRRPFRWFDTEAKQKKYSTHTFSQKTFYGLFRHIYVQIILAKTFYGLLGIFLYKLCQPKNVFNYFTKHGPNLRECRVKSYNNFTAFWTVFMYKFRVL